MTTYDIQVTFEEGSLWASVTGSVGDLMRLRMYLDAWVSGLSRGSGGVPVHASDGNGCKVLVGALLEAMQQGVASGLDEGDVPEALTEKARLLVAEGLLRGYQAEAAVKALSAPMGRGVVDMFMGGGKTRLSAALAALGGGKWLYLVQNKELARQSRAAFEEVLDEMCEVTDFTASIEATTYAGVEKLSTWHYDGVIVDEVHCLPARTRALEYAKIQAQRRIGLSGTPLDRQDARNAMVIALTGPVICKVTYEELVANGYLSEGKLHTVKYCHV